MTGGMRLLDLFCCAGGAGAGYARAGFTVTGVDVEPQRRYPFAFLQRDVLTLSADWIREHFDAVHASPPCQGYTEMVAPGQVGAPRLIDETRALLEATGLPWIIENVEGARSAMRSPLLLCGTMFGLGAQGHELQRHRLFESNVDLATPSCAHSARPVIGVYGGHARNRSASNGNRGSTRDVWAGGHGVAASAALGIDWMTLAEMSEAIPPAYTEFLGVQLAAHIASERLAA